MGCGASAEAVPEVGDVIYCPRDGAFGKVAKVEVKQGSHRSQKVFVHLEECNPEPDTERYEVSSKVTGQEGTVGWHPLQDIPAFANFVPTLQVTAEYRGQQCNGFIIIYDETSKLLTVHFYGDEAADKYDKTHWKMGTSEKYEASQLTPGHVGAHHPPLRTPEQIAENKAFIKSLGANRDVHCVSCGIPAWEDPCDCYPTKKRKGFFCAKCGEEHDSDKARCCGEQLFRNDQNQGWIYMFSSWYGKF